MESEEPLRVVAEITRRDLFDVSLRFTFGRRWIWAFCAALFLINVWSQCHSEYHPSDQLAAVCTIAVITVMWIVFYFVASLFMAIAMVLQVQSKPGVIGSHTTEIRSDGLFENTSASQTLVRWAAVSKVLRTDRYILISFTWWLFYFIPRRAFPDNSSYNAFAKALQERVGGKGKDADDAENHDASRASRAR